MPPTPDAPPILRFGIAVRISHDHAQLTLAGEINQSNADEMRHRAQYYLDEPKIAHVIVDLDALTLIDPDGLRALRLCRRYADEIGKTFIIEHQRGPVAEAVESAGLIPYLTDPNHLSA